MCVEEYIKYLARVFDKLPNVMFCNIYHGHHDKFKAMTYIAWCKEYEIEEISNYNDFLDVCCNEHRKVDYNFIDGESWPLYEIYTEARKEFIVKANADLKALTKKMCYYEHELDMAKESIKVLESQLGKDKKEVKKRPFMWLEKD